MDHTKGEMRYYNGPNPDIFIEDENGNGFTICDMNTNNFSADECLANARRIVHCCNAHDALVEKATTLIQCLSENPDDYPDQQYYRQVMDKMEALSIALNHE